MELWQLRTFSAVAKNLHFRRAAAELNLSQPAVSHQIKLLEEEIGEPLFWREKDGIFLTRAGQTMFEHANKILDIADELRLEIRENKDILSGKIILGAATRGLGNTFPLIYQKLKETYPDIELVPQIEHRLFQVVEKVKSGEIDIGLVSHDFEKSGLVEIPYGEYELILVAGKKHEFAERIEVTADELQNQQWILFEPENKIRVSADDYLAKIRVIAKNIYETNDGKLICSMVAESNKISLLPEWGVLEELKDGRLIKVKVKDSHYKIQVYLIWKANRRTKLISAVISFLLEEKLQGIKPLESN